MTLWDFTGSESLEYWLNTGGTTCHESQYRTFSQAHC